MAIRKRYYILYLIILTALLVKLYSNENKWKKNISKALEYNKQAKIAMLRLSLKKACHFSYISNKWYGIYESFHILLNNRIKIPEYFKNYLKKAKMISLNNKDPLGCKLIGNIYFKLQKYQTAIMLYKTSYKIYLNNGNLPDAVDTASNIIKAEDKETGIAMLINICKLALHLKRPYESLLSATAMKNNNISTAAHYWFNKTAHLSFAIKDFHALTAVINKMKLHGYTNDSYYWKKKIKHD